MGPSKARACAEAGGQRRATAPGNTVATVLNQHVASDSFSLLNLFFKSNYLHINSY